MSLQQDIFNKLLISRFSLGHQICFNNESLIYISNIMNLHRKLFSKGDFSVACTSVQLCCDIYILNRPILQTHTQLNCIARNLPEALRTNLLITGAERKDRKRIDKKNGLWCITIKSNVHLKYSIQDATVMAYTWIRPHPGSIFQLDQSLNVCASQLIVIFPSSFACMRGKIGLCALYTSCQVFNAHRAQYHFYE